ncbi:hypothetical protein M431DRAFT_484558 [Trichoderma harzianum CBS 226.95]|uniref:Uncharacterized protein n=1 Tax=Trichoderma harzianum CBS 226.95 TaxID=983964 RepID=A0A2T4A3C9_TRIHA|nr:hypothetical protein M431DRAFT_484558 [Trichoderma harzianum CBS 226.95]PTB51577.1 hypothetical protein M431DRAFT_484558 [Trichoderma harzianum CBS 226.95]
MRYLQNSGHRRGFSKRSACVYPAVACLGDFAAVAAASRSGSTQLGGCWSRSLVEQHAISPHKRSAAAGSPHFIALPVCGGALVRDGRFTWLKQPRYPAGGTRKHRRRNSAPSPKLIQPGSAVSGSAETRLVGKLSASHSQSAYAIYTAAPTAAPYSWNLDCSQEGSQDPEIRECQMRNGRGHGSGKTKRHRRAETSPARQQFKLVKRSQDGRPWATCSGLEEARHVNLTGVGT